MDIKGSLIDQGNRLSSWTGRDCCNWNGITCNNITRHVQKLDLTNKLSYYVCNETCLGGEINPSLLNLELFEYLDFSFNNFSGVPIPAFFGSLKNLQYLNLQGAGFIGEIPQHLGNLSNLHYLFLGDSSLSAQSLKWIAGLSSLKALDLSFANLSESVDWLYSVNMLPSLSSLTLLDCQLDGAVSPSLSGVNLTSIVSLDLSANNLNSTLLWLFNLSSLENLILYSSNLQGPIPNMFEKLPSLTMLDLSTNSFSSLPDSLCSLTGVTEMDLGHSQLQGSLPLCVGNMTSLRILNLGSNQLGGEIGELGHLRQLTLLDISSNNLNCSIPSSFGQLVELETLDLSNIPLHGTIPSTLGKLTKLQGLELSNNSLIGELCKSFFVELKNLLSLSISKFLVLNVRSLWIPPFQIWSMKMDSVFVGPQFPPWLETQQALGEFQLKNASISGANS